VQPEVISIGEILVDFIPEDDSYKARFGGSPMNTAIALSKLGIRTGVVCSVGDDPWSRFLINTLNKYNIDTSHVNISKKRTTLAFVVKVSEKEREFFFYRKPYCETADSEIKYSEELLRYISQSKITHITGFILSQEPARTSIREIISNLPSNVKLSLDPTLRLDVWPSIDEARRVFREIIGRVDFLLATIKELQLLLKIKDIKEAFSFADEEDMIIGIKMGSKGAVIHHHSETYFMEPYEVEVKDTVGAGDAWNAGFIYGTLKRYSLAETLMIANAVASLKVREIGAIKGLPTIDEVHKLMRDQKITPREYNP